MAKKMKNQNPPRRVEIRGQDHLLAYITPAEAQLLMDNGGSGEPGPMGIPAYRTGPGDMGGSAGSDSDGNGGNGGNVGGGGGGDPRGESSMSGGAGAFGEAGRGGGTGVSGMSPGRSQAQFGTTEFAGMTESEALGQIGAGEASQQAMAVQANLQAQRAAEIAALENLNRSLLDLSRRERKAEQIPGILGKIALANVRSLASNLIGKDLGVLGSFGIGQKGLENFAGLPVGMLASRQDRAVTNDMGQVIGFRDEYGNLVAGRDPNAMGPDGDGPEIVPTQTNPVTGQEECPSGYTFDGDINACRIDAPLENVGDTVGGTGFDYEPGTYARMGLLDVAPEDLGTFASTYGTGFGTPRGFEDANLAYRRRAGTRAGIFQDPYNLSGYTLLA